MDEELLSKLSDILAEKNIDLNDIMSNIQATSSNQDKTQDSEKIPDIETILKLKKLATLFTQSTNSKDESLLKALKPYLRDSRKNKIDQYIKILHILNLLENFQEMGGNLNDIL